MQGENSGLQDTMDVKSQCKHSGLMKKSNKKKRKIKAVHKELSERQPNSVLVAATYSEDGKSIAKKKSKKKKKKSKKSNTDTTGISALLEKILAPYRRNSGSVAWKKSKKRKVKGNGVNLCGESDTGESNKKTIKEKERLDEERHPTIGDLVETTAPNNSCGTSVEKKKKKKICGEDLESLSSDGEKCCVSAEDHSSSNNGNSEASTSKGSDVSGKPVCKYRPAQEVLNTDDFTEEQRKANEYVLAGKYLPTISECLCNDFGLEKRPYIPSFSGDPICPYCHSLFRSITSLDRHVSAVHFNIRNFECSWCGQRFSDKVTMKAHELIHMDAAPHSCKYCDRVFRYSSHKCAHLRQHMRDWGKILVGIETKRLQQKKAKAKKLKKKKVSRKGMFEERLEDEDDLIASIINVQTETINGIKESFA